MYKLHYYAYAISYIIYINTIKFTKIQNFMLFIYHVAKLIKNFGRKKYFHIFLLKFLSFKINIYKNTAKLIKNFDRKKYF